MKEGAPLLLLCGLACLTPPPVPPYKEAPIKVAITIDDLPAHGPTVTGLSRLQIATAMLEVLARHRVPQVYGFVNGKKVDDDPHTRAVLQAWVDAGHPLGNHTHSHLSLHTATVGAYLTDIERGEVILRPFEPAPNPDRPGRRPEPWKVFRYPFLFEGETMEKRNAVRTYLVERGYRIAPVSIDSDDWAFNAPYARCLEQSQVGESQRLIRSFVNHHLHELEVMEMMLYRLEGRAVPQILLLHIGVADAAALDALLTAYEERGVQWIGLDEALADPFYALDPATPARYGAAHPYRIAKQRGVRAPQPVFATALEGQLEAICR